MSFSLDSRTRSLDTSRTRSLDSRTSCPFPSTRSLDSRTTTGPPGRSPIDDLPGGPVVVRLSTSLAYRNGFLMARRTHRSTNMSVYAFLTPRVVHSNMMIDQHDPLFFLWCPIPPIKYDTETVSSPHHPRTEESSTLPERGAGRSSTRGSRAKTETDPNTIAFPLDRWTEPDNPSSVVLVHTP